MPYHGVPGTTYAMNGMNGMNLTVGTVYPLTSFPASAAPFTPNDSTWRDYVTLPEAVTLEPATAYRLVFDGVLASAVVADPPKPRKRRAKRLKAKPEPKGRLIAL